MENLLVVTLVALLSILGTFHTFITDWVLSRVLRKRTSNSTGKIFKLKLTVFYVTFLIWIVAVTWYYNSSGAGPGTLTVFFFGYLFTAFSGFIAFTNVDIKPED